MCAYVYRLIPGTKKMDVVNTSRSFVWNGTEVLKIAGQGALYILASVPYPDEVFQVIILTLPCNVCDFLQIFLFTYL